MPKRARDEFLEALAAGWSVTHAAKHSGVLKQRLYEIRDGNEEFAAAWDEALEAGTQRLEDEALRRAVDGYEEETFDGKGALMRRVRRYDSSLLQLLLKGRRPQTYRDNAIGRVELTGPGGGPVELAPGREPTTLASVIALAGELGVLERMGYRRDEIVGEVIDEEPLELTDGGTDA